MNLASFLHASADAHPERPAVTDARVGCSLNYGQLAREAGRVAAFRRAQGVEPRQRIGVLAPNDLAYLSAAFGLRALAYHFAVTIVAYIRAGAHILMCPDTLPPTLIYSIQRLEPSVLYASPFHFERPGNLDARVPLTRPRLALSTTAPITAAVMDRFESLYGVPVGQAYGLIEAGLPCVNTRTDELPSISVGRSVPGYEVAVSTTGASGLLRAGSVRLPCEATVCFPRTPRRGSFARTSIRTAGS